MVTHCDNGSVMAVLKGYPYMLVPDCNEALIKGLAVKAKVMETVMNKKVATTSIVVAGLMVFCICFWYGVFPNENALL